MNKRFESILNLMPHKIKDGLCKLSDIAIEEIRVKANAPVLIYSKNTEFNIYSDNEVVYASMDDINEILKKATKNSLYAFLEDIKCGFITIENGHRIGVGGRAVYEGNKLINIKEISSLNIRCANEIPGVGERIVNNIFEEGILKNTLIISPPKCGKTTVLRDITRLLSKMKSMKIILIDERDEIASAYMGNSSNDIGERTFVLSGYLKKEGFTHAIRSLAPTVIICDEIGDSDDISVMNFAIVRGVKIIASIHGDCIEDVLYKNNFKSFERIVLLDKNYKSKIYTLNNGEYYEL